MEPQSLDVFIRRKDAAAMLSITVRMLDYLISQQRIAHMRFGRAVRFKKEHVEDYIRKNTIPVFVQPERKALTAIDVRMGRF